MTCEDLLVVDLPVCLLDIFSCCLCRCSLVSMAQSHTSSRGLFISPACYLRRSSDIIDTVQVTVVVAESMLAMPSHETEMPFRLNRMLTHYKRTGSLIETI